MIENVVVHIANEQPILVDLVFEPAPADVALICRNLRAMNGKKPVFVDNTDSTFVISLANIRFIEIPRRSMEALEAEKLAAATAVEATAATRGAPVGDRDELGEDGSGEAPLARLAWLTGGGSVPIEDPVESGTTHEPEPQAPGDDLDGELLRRIREV